MIDSKVHEIIFWITVIHVFETQMLSLFQNISNLSGIIFSGHWTNNATYHDWPDIWWTGSPPGVASSDA